MIKKENRLTEYLQEHFEELGALDFYRFLFPKGELQEKGVYGDGKYNAILVEVTNEKNSDGRDKVLRHTITDDLDKISEVIQRDNFCLMSPISYIGKKRTSENARALYVLTVDLDGVIIKEDGDPIGLRTLFHQIEEIERIPMPTVIVSSGTGLHLYYIFEKPIMLFPNVVKQLQKYKREITRIIWQGYITNLEDNVQYESLFQGFRVIGTITKQGERARAFLVGDRVTMDYMNRFFIELNGCILRERQKQYIKDKTLPLKRICISCKVKCKKCGEIIQTDENRLVHCKYSAVGIDGAIGQPYARIIGMKGDFEDLCEWEYEKTYITKEEGERFYYEFLKLDQEQIDELIEESQTEDEKLFYKDLWQLVEMDRTEQEIAENMNEIGENG